MGSLHFMPAGSAHIEAQFARPQEDPQGVDHTLLGRMKAMIDGCPAGETIRTTIYSLTVPYMRDALIAAKNRGCTVYVLHQGAQKGLTIPEELAAGIGTTHHWSGEGEAGDYGCLGDGVGTDLHTKLMLFTKTTDPNGVLRNKVVWWGSANMSFASGSNTANDAVAIYDDATLYDNIRINYWAKLWDEIPYANNDFYDGTLTRGKIPGGADTQTTFYCSPEQQVDLWVNRLNEVRFDASDSSTPEIYVAMDKFHTSRIAVADELVRLRGLGAHVQVMGGDGIDEFQDPIRSRLLNGGVLIKDAPIHDKFVIIKGAYGSTNVPRKVVLGGSHNCTLSALTQNDEIIVKTFHDGLYDAYKAHYDFLWVRN